MRYQTPLACMAYEPPFLETCKTLFQKNTDEPKEKVNNFSMIDECELPLIDLSGLNSCSQERDKCQRAIVKASSEWGFFQIVNHGVPRDVLKRMQYEQMGVFRQPFFKKAENNFLNLSANSYRWGNPAATCLRQFSWSEAFHIPLTDISRMDEYMNLRSTIEAFSTVVANLAQVLAEILAQNLGVNPSFFHDKCLPNTCYLRMNRYPPCPIDNQIFGLMPHTDSDFLTILYQDQVGGLQLVKDGIWYNVKPNPSALLINIGDLFQVLSNGVYKSAKHQVVANQEVERFSVAYFYCPSHDAEIQSCVGKAMYRKFYFREYKEQVKEDVKLTGEKIGLSRFRM